MKYSSIAAAAVLCLWAAVAQAAPDATGAPQASKPDKFAMMDANKDGKVTYEEFKAFYPDMREEAFTVIDKNGDKVIDRVEWDTFVENHASGHMGGMMGGNGMPGNASMPSPGSADMPLVMPPNGK